MHHVLAGIGGAARTHSGVGVVEQATGARARRRRCGQRIGVGRDQVLGRRVALGARPVGGLLGDGRHLAIQVGAQVLGELVHRRALGRRRHQQAGKAGLGLPHLQRVQRRPAALELGRGLGQARRQAGRARVAAEGLAELGVGQQPLQHLDRARVLLGIGREAQPCRADL